MSRTVLVFPRFPKRLFTLLGERYEVLDPGRWTPAEAFTPEQRAKAQVLVTAGGMRTTRQFIDALPNLKLIACYGTGYDGVDRRAAREKGILVCNSPGANAASVADLAIALMLAIMRGIPRGDAFARSGGWAAGERFNVAPALAMTGRRIGVYGMGKIGRKIAVRAAAFDSDVQYFSRRKLDDVSYSCHPTLESLVEWCDVLQVAVRAGPENDHIIDRHMLRRLGPQGYLINISRGTVIDEVALIEALQNKLIAGAALDVYQNEPRINPGFFALQNTVLSPHLGAHTIEAHERMQDGVIKNLEAFFAGSPLLNPVPLE